MLRRLALATALAFGTVVAAPVFAQAAAAPTAAEQLATINGSDDPAKAHFLFEIECITATETVPASQVVKVSCSHCPGGPSAG